MKTRLIVSFFVLSLVLARVGAAQELLASAKTLYEAASYEAALSELNAINSHEHLDVVDTYKALCFLGLGRTREAERALELIVTRKPLMTLSESDYSPRIVALFRDVRRRALPQAAQQLYSLAKADYESQNYDSAAAAFKQVLEVIADVDPKEQTANLTDLKQLADGFLALAESKAVRQPAPAAARAVAPASAATPPAVAPPVASPCATGGTTRRDRGPGATGGGTARRGRSPGTTRRARGHFAADLHARRFERDSPSDHRSADAAMELSARGIRSKVHRPAGSDD